LGRFIGRLRNMTTEVRRQTGIDEILRQEGIQGGLAELRGIVRGDLAALHRAATMPVPLAPDAVVDQHGDAVEFDRWREYPIEGPDSYGAIPEDLAVVPEPELHAMAPEPKATPPLPEPKVTPPLPEAKATPPLPDPPSAASTEPNPPARGSGTRSG